MADKNRITLSGRLTRDPEIRYVGNDQIPVVKFGIASDSRKKDHTNFFDVEAWRKTAELINQYFGKGDYIDFEGKIEYRTYEHEGQKRVAYDITVEDLYFAPRNPYKSGKGGEGTQAQAQPQQKPASRPAPSTNSNFDDDVPF